MSSQEQAVLVYLKLSDDAFGVPEDREALYSLEDDITDTLENAGTGSLDGHEIGQGFGVLFIYGPDVERLLQSIIPIIRKYSLRKGSYLLQRYDGSGENEKIIEL